MLLGVLLCCWVMLCDRVYCVAQVSNPWGPCTWELGFQSAGGKMPSRPDSSNPLTVSNNVHMGLEVRRHKV